MQTNAKITPADYPDLLAAVDAGIPQRELARRYDCAPSLVARHAARAKRARELGERPTERNRGLNGARHLGSLREILEERIRDPKTPARDLASLTNALARLPQEGQRSGQASILDLRPPTLILEPGPGGPNHCFYRLIMRGPGGIEHVSDPVYDLTARQALYFIFCALGHEFGLTPDDILRGLTPDDILRGFTQPAA